MELEKGDFVEGWAPCWDVTGSRISMRGPK